MNFYGIEVTEDQFTQLKEVERKWHEYQNPEINEDFPRLLKRMGDYKAADLIMKASSIAHGKQIETILGRGRKGIYVRARMAACFFMHNYLDLRYRDIALKMGFKGTDHASIIYYNRKANEAMNGFNPDLKRSIDNTKKELIKLLNDKD